MLVPVAPMMVGAEGVERVQIGGGAGLAVIAGPCVIEEPERVERICAGLVQITRALGLPFIFKASFDKANRTSLHSYRGPGMREGLDLLAHIRGVHGVPVTTDVHLPAQAGPVAEVVDLVQIPAFLCRQTDLLVAAAQAGRPVNLKKGQFMSPMAMGPAVAKLVASGAPGVMVTERGSSFGYGDLVVDLRSLPRMRGLGVPVCFDATHSVQRPGGQGDRSGGDRSLVPTLARGAVAAGVDAVFLEVHDDPDQAKSDGPNMVRLDEVGALLGQLAALDAVVRG